MHDPIQALIAEHSLLADAINTGRKAQKVEDGILFRSLMHDLIIFFRNFTELHHHPKEEDILYPLLRNRTRDMSEDFVNEIYDNHEDFAAYMAEMENHFVNYNNTRLKEVFSTYLDAYETHIREENKIVLSVAGGLISEKEKSEIVEKFDALDEKNRINTKTELISLLQKVKDSLEVPIDVQ